MESKISLYPTIENVVKNAKTVLRFNHLGWKSKYEKNIKNQGDWLNIKLLRFLDNISDNVYKGSKMGNQPSLNQHIRYMMCNPTYLNSLKECDNFKSDSGNNNIFLLKSEGIFGKYSVHTCPSLDTNTILLGVDENMFLNNYYWVRIIIDNYMGRNLVNHCPSTTSINDKPTYL